MFRRRRRFRRFGGRGVKRREPVWIQTAYNVPKEPTVTFQDLFQLVGPEDYTPDYITEPQRLERSTLLRTVGGFSLVPVMPAPTTAENNQRSVRTNYKAALFIAGDKQIDDGFANDPGQFEIFDPAVFVVFCRDFAPMKIFWNKYAVWSQDAGTDYGDYWVPPAVTLNEEWDVTVKRKMQGDEGLYLLINGLFQQSHNELFGGSIDVESRNLLND